MYYWNYGTIGGKPYLTGPFDTEAQSADDGFRTFDGGNFETFPLNTRDRAKATQEVKYMLKERGMPMNEALQPMGHQSAG